MSVSLRLPYNGKSRDEFFLKWDFDLWFQSLAHLTEQSNHSELKATKFQMLDKFGIGARVYSMNLTFGMHEPQNLDVALFIG